MSTVRSCAIVHAVTLPTRCFRLCDSPIGCRAFGARGTGNLRTNVLTGAEIAEPEVETFA